MPNFTNQTPASTYPDILTIGTLNQVGLTNVLSQVQDASGRGTNLSLSTLGFNIARSGYFFSLDSVNITAQGVDINSMCQPNPVALGTGSLTVAAGTTAERPLVPVNGMIRYNASLAELEAFEAGIWTPIATGTVGTVTSVAAVVNGIGMSITGSPITTAGTFTFTLASELQGLSQIIGTGMIAHTASNTYTERTITGTALQIDVVNGDGVLGNPTISIDAGYVGQTSITTLGTITTGTWHGTAIDETHGGTNQTTYILGDTLYASGANTLAKLAGNTANTIKYLAQTGTGVVSAAPAWTTISGGDITGAALTKTDDTNVTLTLGGSPTTALLRATSLTLGWTGQLSLARGGTNANLTASNGGIVWSNATQLQILSGTATADQVLLSGSNATPSWSTATYPATTTINQLLYSSANNVITGLATTNSASLSTNASGVPTWLALTDGQIVIGSSIGAPLAASISAGTGITVTPGHNTITISSSAVSSNWIDQTITPVTLAANTSYSANNAGLVTFNMPATVSFGSIFTILGEGAGGWLLQFNIGQTGHLNSSATTSGGSFASTERYDAITLVCTVANTTFVAVSSSGVITNA